MKLVWRLAKTGRKYVKSFACNRNFFLNLAGLHMTNLMTILIKVCEHCNEYGLILCSTFSKKKLVIERVIVYSIRSITFINFIIQIYLKI